MSNTDDLKRDARFVAQGCDDLDGLIGNVDLHDDEIEDAFFIYQRLGEASKILTDVRHQLGHKIGEAIGAERTTLMGKTVQRRAYVSRKNWQHDDLRRVVLDSVIANEDGEKVDETPADKLLAVWKMRGYDASITALRDRGIDPDEFSEHRFERWTLEVK